MIIIRNNYFHRKSEYYHCDPDSQNIPFNDIVVVQIIVTIILILLPLDTNPHDITNVVKTIAI